MGVSGDDMGALAGNSGVNPDLRQPSIGEPSGVHHDDTDHQPTQAPNAFRSRQPADTVLMGMLYERHADALWRYALRLTDDPASAEHVVRETLLRALPHAEAGDVSERLARTWLFAVARTIIDERRVSRFHNGVDSPREVNAGTNWLLIGDALTQLSAEHRAVVRRSYYQRLPMAQIADELQIAEGTVRSRLHYAARALRLTLQESGLTQ
jgi:RNA polymerase sigma-70 factor (ECF subfamily)